jgi:hypothetical protein
MVERLLYRATKEGERRVASSAGFRVPLTLGSYRAPVEPPLRTCTSTLTLHVFEDVLTVEDGILGARLRATFLLLVDLSVHVQDFPSAIAGGAKYPALYRR